MNTDKQLPSPDKKPMRCVLVALPSEWVDQLDAFSAFYSKSRLALIRELIKDGIGELITSYAGKEQELEDMKKYFAEIQQKTVENEVKKQAGKATRWEDSY